MTKYTDFDQVLVNHQDITEIDLRENNLTEIGPLTNLTNLTYLYLCSNSLESLPAEIGQLANLITLDLRCNRFRNERKEELRKL